MSMPRLDVLLAANGVAILLVALVAGLFLYRTLLRLGDPHDWHLLHAGGSGRGVMLMALAAIIHLPLLRDWLLNATALAIIVFAWASTISMIITAVTGEHGFRQTGPAINRVAHLLYVMGAVAVFPAMIILGYGLLMRLAN